jgi:hypothetical protein
VTGDPREPKTALWELLLYVFGIFLAVALAALLLYWLSGHPVHR